MLESWCVSTADEEFLPIAGLIPEHRYPLAWKPKVVRSYWSSLVQQVVDTPRMLAGVDAACRRAAQEIDERRFDILFATNCVLSSVPSIARHASLRSVLYLHEPRRVLYEASPDLPWVGGFLPTKREGARRCITRGVKVVLRRRNARMLAAEEIQNAASYTQILVNSRFTRESALRAYNTDSRVCYQGVDLSVFRDEGRERENLVLGVGEYSAHKGIPAAIEAVSLLGGLRPRFVWAGNGGSKAYLNEMAALARHKNVDFEPLFGVAEAYLVDLYNRARVLLYTSRLEPFGLAPLEANACGTPVVAVAEGGPRETIVDKVNGFLVGSDPAEVSQAVRQLIEDPSLGREMGRRGRALVEEQWSLDGSVRRLESELLRVAGAETRG